MEPVPTVVNKLKDFAKLSQDFAHGLLRWHQNSNRRSPIEILKRLQREAFSDIMKLRDRQEKVERLLTFYKTSKGSPFQEASTHVKGKVDVLGALVIMNDVDEQKYDAIQRSGIRTGIDARLTFETGIRESDTLVAEFIASEKGQGDILGGPLSLAKILYAAHVSDWFSAVAIPMGAQCRDVGVPTVSPQERGLTHYSEFGPPLLDQHNGSAIGIMVRKSNVVASLAQFVSGLGMQVNSAGVARSLSTFGQVVWQLSGNTRLSCLGVHRESRPPGQNVSLGALALPVSPFRSNRFSDTSVEEDSPTNTRKHNLDGSIAVMLNTELDESTRIGAWIETKNSNHRCFQWAVTMRDTPEDEEFGWGLTVGGMAQGPKTLEHFQVETFLNLKFGKRFKLQPALLYVKDGATQFPALMLRSNWSL
ncbi:hypothetical protein CDL12_00531 [Handroanthus impetiginosus]|uniref:Uncharacterized protein n=1 Tax=Handroanthus impetiginosus TaxID=429701 RepID=A0A2G9IAL9_9LAMI|nr:hypothetical protein CDL12_00531 [Handroanthus impetiginosus]